MLSQRMSDNPSMRWIMERGQQQLRCEILTGRGLTPYALVIETADGGHVLNEQFAEPYVLHERVTQVEHLFDRHGWASHG